MGQRTVLMLNSSVSLKSHLSLALKPGHDVARSELFGVNFHFPCFWFFLYHYLALLAVVSHPSLFSYTLQIIWLSGYLVGNSVQLCYEVVQEFPPKVLTLFWP